MATAPAAIHDELRVAGANTDDLGLEPPPAPDLEADGNFDIAQGRLQLGLL